MEFEMTRLRSAYPQPGPRQRQDGIVLFVALIVMVAMSLAAIALIRSVDTTNAVVGNLAFRLASILPANGSIETAAAALFPDADIANVAHIPDPTNDLAAENYFASRQAGEDARGVPVKLQKHSTASVLPKRFLDSSDRHRSCLCDRAHVPCERPGDDGELRPCATEGESGRHDRRQQFRWRKRSVLPRHRARRRPQEHSVVRSGNAEVGPSKDNHDPRRPHPAIPPHSCRRTRGPYRARASRHTFLRGADRAGGPAAQRPEPGQAEHRPHRRRFDVDAVRLPARHRGRQLLPRHDRSHECELRPFRAEHRPHRAKPRQIRHAGVYFRAIRNALPRLQPRVRPQRSRARAA